jgi:hypothetical protein
MTLVASPELLSAIKFIVGVITTTQNNGDERKKKVEANTPVLYLSY